MLEVFLSCGILPVFDGLWSKSKDLIDTIKLAKWIKNIHFRNVAKIFLTWVVVWILDHNINDEVFIFNQLQFSVFKRLIWFEIFNSNLRWKKFF